MARKNIIAGNWKMNKTVGEGVALVDALKPLVADLDGADIVVCPPFTALYAVGEAIKGTKIALGAQNAFWKPSGAYTSQISVPMLQDLGVQYVILGHSETRGRFGVVEEGMTEHLLGLFGETDAGVNLKLHAVLAAGLAPILCVGETLKERQDGHTDSIVRAQTTRALRDVSAELVASKVVIAYEPVWAIGTGETCEAGEADRVCGQVREAVADLFDDATAGSVRIQYGGSMKPDNARELLAYENIDGGLIGGASLKAADFAAIVRAAAS